MFTTTSFASPGLLCGHGTLHDGHRIGGKVEHDPMGEDAVVGEYMSTRIFLGGLSFTEKLSKEGVTTCDQT